MRTESPARNDIHEHHYSGVETATLILETNTSTVLRPVMKMKQKKSILQISNLMKYNNAVLSETIGLCSEVLTETYIRNGGD